MKPFIAQVKSGQNLTVVEAEAAFQKILSGKVSEDEIGEFLVALKEKGETTNEILGAARVVRLQARPAKLGGDILDVCGTGGDGLNTLNISTAVAFVLAGAGVKVAKHGNKAITSKSGSSDVLSALGINLQASPEVAIEKTNFCYLNAPDYHPAMRILAPIRAKLQTRTIFNLLGPLLNPANTKRQLIGVYSPNLLRPFAEVLRALGAEKAWIVHGSDGLDEMSISGETMVCELDKGAIDTFTITPEDAALPRGPLEEIKGGTGEENAGKLLDLLKGKAGTYRNIVLLNAASGLLVAEKCETLEEGVAIAAKSIDSGRALKVLEKLRDL